MMNILQRTYHTYRERDYMHAGEKRKIRSCFLFFSQLEKLQKICSASKQELTTLAPGLREAVPIAMFPYFDDGEDSSESFAQGRANKYEFFYCGSRSFANKSCGMV
ncbi:unnamed protein product [Amoebophrya sp. A25]|nr:unnamed protein product [Amoebophrya sp. A25]|eukprot:GSA25T00017633001.1